MDHRRLPEHLESELTNAQGTKTREPGIAFHQDPSGCYIERTSL
jgi:hypothetical protein